jgi:hypothetical protein
MDAPTYDASTVVNRDYERNLHDHYLARRARPPE